MKFITWKEFIQFKESATQELKSSRSKEKVRGPAPYSQAARNNLRNAVLDGRDDDSYIGQMMPKKEPAWRPPAETEEIVRPARKQGLNI